LKSAVQVIQRAETGVAAGVTGTAITFPLIDPMYTFWSSAAGQPSRCGVVGEENALAKHPATAGGKRSGTGRRDVFWIVDAGS
jgi:hypothetical protein